MGEAHELTDDEKKVFYMLTRVWNAYVQLPIQHPTHQREFMEAIHAAQRLIMSRPVARFYDWVQVPLEHAHEIVEAYED